jgi:hypothetical protein
MARDVIKVLGSSDWHIRVASLQRLRELIKKGAARILAL